MARLSCRDLLGERPGNEGGMQVAVAREDKLGLDAACRTGVGGMFDTR